jgi:hypothetical protein
MKMDETLFAIAEKVYGNLLSSQCCGAGRFLSFSGFSFYSVPLYFRKDTVPVTVLSIYCDFITGTFQAFLKLF